jgi:hypothetical protein
MASGRVRRDDGYNLCEAPDNVSTAAVAIAIGGSGALSKIDESDCRSFALYGFA